MKNVDFIQHLKEKEPWNSYNRVLAGLPVDLSVEEIDQACKREVSKMGVRADGSPGPLWFGHPRDHPELAGVFPSGRVELMERSDEIKTFLAGTPDNWDTPLSMDQVCVVNE